MNKFLGIHTIHALSVVCACTMSISSLYANACCVTNCSTSCYKNCDDCASSKTFFFVRPLYQSVRPELIAGFRNERAGAREDGRGGAIDIVPFGSKSGKDHRLASYFMPYGKTVLQASDSTADGFPNGAADLDARQFGIETSDDGFKSTVCFSMNQSVAGLGLQYLQRFAWHDATQGWWFSASSPISHVKNTVTLAEKIESQGTPEALITNMTQAFRQPAWCYGKVDNCAHTKTGLADIETKLGYEWLPCPEGHIALYTGVLIPTGNKPCAQYIFEPIIGHDHHWGLMWGIQAGFQLWEQSEKERSLNFECMAHGQYLFSNTQRRSFDLIDKPWSRYMQVYANKAQAQLAQETADGSLATPGINVFTRNLKVTPALSSNMTSALVFTAGGFQSEIGYNIFYRQAECVKLACPWPTGENAPALKSRTQGLGDPAQYGLTNPVRTIAPNAILNDPTITENFGTLADYEKNIITINDIDLCSAAHPGMLANILYGSLGYRWDEIEYPVHLSGGASYEFSRKSAAVMNRWVIWTKGGFSF